MKHWAFLVFSFFTPLAWTAYELPSVPMVHFQDPSPWKEVLIPSENHMTHWSKTIHPALLDAYSDQEAIYLQNQILAYQKSRLPPKEFAAFQHWYSQHIHSLTPGENWARLPVEGDTSDFFLPLPQNTRNPRGKTKYPILFLHGLAGRLAYKPVAPCIHYWGEIPEKLGLQGAGFDIHFAEAGYLEDSMTRGPILYRTLQEVLRKTGARRVHIVSHSQGGLDARVLQTGLGLADQIASITTITTPHLGLRIDAIPFRYRMILQSTNWLFGSDWMPTLMDFREPYIQNYFNVAFPHIPTHPFLSYGGKAYASDQELSTSGQRVRRAFLHKLYTKLELAYPYGEFARIHDGIVPLAATPWGQFIGILEADHLEQTMGMGPFPHVEFFQAHLELLQQLERESSI